MPYLPHAARAEASLTGRENRQGSAETSVCDSTSGCGAASSGQVDGWSGDQDAVPGAALRMDGAVAADSAGLKAITLDE